MKPLEMHLKNQYSNGHVMSVVDANDVLLGLFTDRDVRRFIIKSWDLFEKIENVMNKSPVV